MKVAVMGPICKDTVIIEGKIHKRLGGLAYYAGQALSRLGIDVTLFATYGKENKNWLKNFAFNGRINHITAEKTLKFTNIYPKKNSDERTQKTEAYDNKITAEDINKYDLDGFQYIILGPLFHDNITKEAINELSKKTAKLILSPQGMIRYAEEESVVWKNPNNVTEALKHIEYLFLDENELRFISQKNDITEAAHSLQEKGTKNIIATKASHGSTLFLQGKKYEIKAFPPKQLADQTGAGDTYLAGFVKATELFSDPIKQGEFAAMAATIKIEKSGAFNSNTEEVIKRIAES